MDSIRRVTVCTYYSTAASNILEGFLIIKPTRCTNYPNLFLEQNSTCFGQFLCPLSGVLRCTQSNGICHKVLLTACEQEHLLRRHIPEYSKTFSHRRGHVRSDLFRLLSPLAKQCATTPIPSDGYMNKNNPQSINVCVCVCV